MKIILNFALYVVPDLSRDRNNASYGKQDSYSR